MSPGVGLESGPENFILSRPILLFQHLYQPVVVDSLCTVKLHENLQYVPLIETGCQLKCIIFIIPSIPTYQQLKLCSIYFPGKLTENIFQNSFHIMPDGAEDDTGKKR
ncbi:hypothetical protein E2C01_046592 [Portunus trituberculatus]|uniref:Uncharacterized protein n=1 Tax=Portunus trituberculatus TaxID=210409 RepID=A0A5B7G5I0_PORTR|nr:hypothetical protein [Portunus trituberculatus]